MHRLLFFISLALYVVALFLPVYNGHDFNGMMALGLGWLVGANDWATAVSWFANIFYFLAIIKFLKRKSPKAKSALVYGALSILIGLSVLAAGKAFVSKDSSASIQSFSLGLAFYAWMASFVVLCIAAWFKIKFVNSANIDASNTNVN